MLCRIVILASLVALGSTQLPCGKPRPTTRVVGGTDSKMGKLPWQVDLTEPRMGIPFCSGVLVSPQYVLTAASCADAKANFDLVVSEHDWEKINRVIRRQPIEKIVHPNYEGGIDYNIALVKLSDGLINSVPSICLPSKKFKVKKPFIAGWGATVAGGMVSENLQERKVQLMKTCVDTSIDSAVTQCAQEGGLCDGDEGSPLMVFSKRKHTLVGIASEGGCAEAASLDYYTNVKAPEIRDWINSIIA